jgi:hypothetical protein
VAKKKDPRETGAVPAARTAGDGIDRASTGIEGLDDVLGADSPCRLHLIQGAPGAGKTKLALQFLLAGSARNESGLLISLSETEDEVRAEAAAPFQPLGFLLVQTGRSRAAGEGAHPSRTISDVSMLRPDRWRGRRFRIGLIRVW